MFHTISERMRRRMRFLEQMDEIDRRNGTPRADRLRQIPPVTGRFLALMAATAPVGKIVEIGTSAGYSTLWLALAAQATGKHVTTFEVLDNKIKLATETLQLAGIQDMVQLIQGDARDHLALMASIGFCFLDAEKELYQDCYDLVVPNLVSGGILLADNVISHAQGLEHLVQFASADPRVDTVVVPIGKGLLFCRKI